MTDNCPICNNSFPQGLLEGIYLNGSYARSCPICALRLRNALHELPLSTRFHGPIAHQMFLRAVEHLGERAPKWARKIARKSLAAKPTDG